MDTKNSTELDNEVLDLNKEHAREREYSDEISTTGKVQKIPPAIRHRPGDDRRLRQRIVAIDLFSALVSFASATWLTGLFRDRGSITPMHILVGGLALMAVVFTLSFLFQLYRTQITFVASDERLRVFLVALIAGAVASVIDSAFSNYVSFIFATFAGATYLFCDLFFRALFRNWLKVQRAQGRYHREVLLVGTNADALAMYKLLRTQQDVGYTIVGVIGDKAESENFNDIAWCGSLDDVTGAVRKTGATGVIIASNVLNPYELRKMSNKLLSRSVHVHVSAGLYGFDERRLRQQNFSREPVFYVEPLTFPLFQRALKRSFDIVVSAIGLLFSAPIIAIAAVMIKLDDRGPVFFRQTRIGKNTTSFKCVKLRTMSVDAEKNLDKLMDNNERTGPLFKQKNDPRRTRVGKFLEATSLDELPQLYSVLKGTMSIVGPRPAMPHEVALFDEELNVRHLVRPGITGLWQVESRDNPSFEAYRRLDIFYVENWSMLLDLSILGSTFHVVIARAIKTFGAFRRPSWVRSGVEDPGVSLGE